MISVKARKPTYTVVILTTVGMLMPAGMVLAAEFSADKLMKTGSLAPRSSRMYIKGMKQREEIREGSKRSLVIKRLDKGLTWELNPATKSYTESRIHPEGVRRQADLPAALRTDPRAKLVGKERVNGYDCLKYEYKWHSSRHDDTGVTWVSTKLGIQMRSRMKCRFGLLWNRSCRQTLDVTNVVEKRLPDSLFEIPRGYRKAARPKRH